MLSEMTWPEEQFREESVTYHLAYCEVGRRLRREDRYQDILEQHF